MAKTERGTLPDWLEPELATPHPGPVLRPQAAQRPLPRAGLSPRGAGGGAARLVCPRQVLQARQQRPGRAQRSLSRQTRSGRRVCRGLGGRRSALLAS